MYPHNKNVSDERWNVFDHALDKTVNIQLLIFRIIFYYDDA